MLHIPVLECSFTAKNLKVELNGQMLGVLIKALKACFFCQSGLPMYF